MQLQKEYGVVLKVNMDKQVTQLEIEQQQQTKRDLIDVDDQEPDLPPYETSDDFVFITISELAKVHGWEATP